MSEYVAEVEDVQLPITVQVALVEGFMLLVGLADQLEVLAGDDSKLGPSYLFRVLDIVDYPSALECF